mmetsp:Transcript_54182/g.117053  ORF Transcript_54182/g.117053 Transcript_54182/m.117053 type:complete len:248 (+) Transcript_54182:689-1432(+)
MPGRLTLVATVTRPCPIHQQEVPVLGVLAAEEGLIKAKGVGLEERVFLAGLALPEALQATLVVNPLPLRVLQRQVRLRHRPEANEGVLINRASSLVVSVAVPGASTVALPRIRRMPLDSEAVIGGPSAGRGNGAPGEAQCSVVVSLRLFLPTDFVLRRPLRPALLLLLVCLLAGVLLSLLALRGRGGGGAGHSCALCDLCRARHQRHLADLWRIFHRRDRSPARALLRQPGITGITRPRAPTFVLQH